ncbi:dTDP-4-dehydrorhamnose 3,5-epimerase [Cryobacterium mesophilum]|uniref:dTDP-4-keto-6-deoxy-D-glucose epimerase n=1 Tax=Terrimesophilobacter mesophilus TaxID=433647 RepID=A0A4R8V8L2_9MICO|nr:dTDP-4-dehydrorhamnose 3,5-epimerase [Terrimesophilobacter mesophilus]MBB5632672.1 dTDP-4-dehydrorhamnose 3,5-epimerase [Terrimesophilobacter mesophilus]TFB79481.1 dTDP-4-keto-6-deoxy-D-glucose epimerase [Terrimesophilobacter mesophilus]
MQIRELSVPGSFEVTPVVRSDDRGRFLEWYRFDALEETVGHPLVLRQANLSVSKRGVLRGIHFADVPLGQAKYVTAASGAVLDFVVDIRTGSPTFGEWDSVLLDATDHRAIYLSEGLGHAFLALTLDATVSYLVSDIYRPGSEHGITPLDPAIGLVFPEGTPEPILSDKDAVAPTLAEAMEQGLLPSYEDCLAFTATLDAVSGSR